MFQLVTSTLFIFTGTALLGAVLPLTASFAIDGLAALRRSRLRRPLLIALGLTLVVGITGYTLFNAGAASPTAAAAHVAAATRLLLVFAPPITLVAFAFRAARVWLWTPASAELNAEPSGPSAALASSSRWTSGAGRAPDTTRSTIFDRFEAL